ncbi:hypothetical protein J8Z24_02900 [Pseudoalteromonas sp. SCSIO 43201]|uniref:hypothetical protein n=1 Tax=Pseudoalteromonas sp. SCSIO 43201 TaxID=2822842 RepID=UPI002074E173|nr:hypothetical protein [Pseudoalteromonas sp. SCSIO 43201]USD29059.1 hypothetical protein J8Z24_02900 [Pseudoalteromonas sp. SCSIO 43201]
MNLGNFIQVKWFGEKLKSQIGYYDDRLYCISHEGFTPSDRVPKVVILARKFYTLRTKDYASISKQELNKILELQKNSSKAKLTYTVNENSSIDGFTVTYIELKNLPMTVTSAAIYIPETELFNREVIAEVNTPNSSFYIGKGTSVVKGGLISTFEAFKYSIGQSSDANNKTFNADEYAEYLLNLLLMTDFKKFRGKIILNQGMLANPLKLHFLYILPLISIFIVLLSVLGWNELKRYQLESKSEHLAPEVSALLEYRNTIDKNNALTQTVTNIVQQTKLVHPIWDVLNIAMNNGFYVDRYEYDGNSFEISGHAKNANQVLKAVSDIELISNASIRGGVRKIRGDDHFTISFQSKVQNETN